jgi:hypothetical protein
MRRRRRRGRATLILSFPFDKCDGEGASVERGVRKRWRGAKGEQMGIGKEGRPGKRRRRGGTEAAAFDFVQLT